MTAILQPHYGQIHERILRAKDGRFMRVRFVIAEVDGHIRGQVLSAEPIFELAAQDRLHQITSQTSSPSQASFPSQLCLPGSISQTPVETVKKVHSYDFARPSSYFTLDFFMSQPTRAPSSV